MESDLTNPGLPTSNEGGADGVEAEELGDGLLEGVVVGKVYGHYDVETPSGRLRCLLRGKLRKQLVYSTSQSRAKRVQTVRALSVTDPVAVGDHVVVRPIDSEDEIDGVIEEVRPRERELTRQAAGERPMAQTLLAGIDQVIVVFAASRPEPHLRMLDRFLIVAEVGEVEAIVCLNKADLGISPDLAESIAEYERIGYRVVLTSVALGDGIEDLRRVLVGKVSAFVGPSGVGKTSLLNAVQPGLGSRIGRVNRVTGKGRHTTTGTTLIPLEGLEEAQVADTPGLRTLGLWDVDADELDYCFREFRPFLGKCAFPDCTHDHEPGCAVLAAVESGEISEARYESYLALRG
jgi:ribosome biogenesis GTPase / thiamine phosphate phosphatase